MRKGDINWQEFAEHLLWRNVVHNKNEDSGYDIMVDDYPDRNIRKDDISGWRFCSYVDPFSHKRLTWKELALELGLFEDILTPDGHDCRRCPEEKKCEAFFKYDKDQERCRWWSENMMEEKKDD